MATTRRAQTGRADHASLGASTSTDRGLWACLSDYERTYMALQNFAEATAVDLPDFRLGEDFEARRFHFAP